MVLISMTNNQDFDDYLKGQLAKTDNNNQNLTLAKRQYAESAIIALVEVAITLLEKKRQIDSRTASFIRNSVSVIDNFGKFIGWW
jgi:hypothetical protein